MISWKHIDALLQTRPKLSARLITTNISNALEPSLRIPKNQKPRFSAMTESGIELINEDLRNEITALAQSTKPESMLKRWDAVMATRRTLNFNVAPLLAIEALLLNVKF